MSAAASSLLEGRPAPLAAAPTRRTLYAAFVALADAVRAEADAQRAKIALQDALADVIDSLAEQQPTEGWLTIDQTAELMGVSSSTVRVLIAEGKLRVVDVTAAAPRVPREAIEEFRRRRERRVRAVK